MTIAEADPFDFARFVAAQAPVIDAVRAELRAGRKRSHWMWFVFPQLWGLGQSSMAQHYGIGSLDEARAYLVHPELGRRLCECTTLVLRHADQSLHATFGSPDDMKFHSSMTLFARASGNPTSLFQQALDQFCGGDEDPASLAILARMQGGATP